MSKTPTVRAVVEYAAKLRREATLIDDPYCNPYAPTEAAARKLSSRYGPESALDHMRARAALHAGERREAAQTAEWAGKRHERRKQQFARDQRSQRETLTLGQRLDQALAEAMVVSEVAASWAPGNDSAADSNAVHLPHSQGSLRESLHTQAEGTVRKIEARLDQARYGTSKAA